MKQKEKVLTSNLVKELGLDKVNVITSDMIEGYTSIECSAFEKCFALTSITIPNSVTSIGEYAFAWCSALTTIDIPNSVKNIGNMAFAWCSALTSITIPNSVKSIGNDAFFSCSSIASITIPNSVTDIGYDAFCNVPNVMYNGTATGSPWAARNVNGYVEDYLVYADDTKTTLLACSAAATGEISIPNSVTSIEDRAFWECSSVTSIILPNSVTSIGGGAFYNCSSLTSITIPNSVTSIGSSAFTDCSSLTSIIIPNSIINIHQNAFYGCCKLSSIVISDKIFETQKVINGKCKAYKAFNADMSCREFQYKEGETYEIEEEPILCRRGFHACLRLTDVFNYYFGKIGKDIVVHEVEIENLFEERRDDSKVVAKKITIGKRIL